MGRSVEALCADPREQGRARSFAEAWSRASAIDGWLTEGQARRLYEAAARVDPGDAIVEIGSHHGRSTLLLASAKRSGVHLVAVDPYDDVRWGGGQDAQAIFRANLHGLDVRLERTFGADAGRDWDGPPVAMLFVDGAHDFPTVLADLRAWLPHLAPDAVVLIHDAYSSVGVTRAVFAEMFASRDFTYAGSSRSLVSFRAGHPGLLARTGSQARMVARLGWFARNVAAKLAHRQGWERAQRLLGDDGTGNPY